MQQIKAPSCIQNNHGWDFSRDIFVRDRIKYGLPQASSREDREWAHTMHHLAQHLINNYTKTFSRQGGHDYVSFNLANKFYTNIPIHTDHMPNVT